jgi:glutaconate CoA-transferase subunit B
MDCSSSEMMIVQASRAIRGARTALVGVGIPNIACNLARLTHTPELILIYESGVVGAEPSRLPLSIGDPALISGALMSGSMLDLFQYLLQGGRVEVAMLGTAQVDRYGNLNTTAVGPYQKPKVRLPGSGGAAEIAANAGKTFVLTRLERRTFVSGLDFVTSPGHIGGSDDRSKLRLQGRGPEMVITDKALFAFAPDSREMILAALYPGVEIQEVREAVGWELAAYDDMKLVEHPLPEELTILRQDLDPEGIFLVS